MSRVSLALALALLAGGCATAAVEPYQTYDPAEGVNRGVYRAFDAVDRRVLRPVAQGYQRVMPDPAERGISNFFANLRDVDGALNSALQGKPKAALGDLVRVVVNSTVGLGGLFDVAGRSGLSPSEEDFGQTLAVWGVTRTAYVVLPPGGPSTVRDAPGALIQSATPSLLLGGGFTWWVGLLDVLSARAGALAATNARDAAALDPYIFTRDAYYQRRQFLIFDGDPPVDDFFDAFDDEE